MRQLNRIEALAMLAGALLMVVGAGLYVFTAAAVAAWLFAAGAVAFASMQLRQTYDGRNTAIRRLRKIMSVADALFILSAALMLENTYHALLPLFLQYIDNGYYAYLTYVHNNWVLLLLVAAILEIYTTHRISGELKKEGQAAGGQA